MNVNRIVGNKLFYLSWLYHDRIYPKIKWIRGATKLSSLLQKIAVNSISREEESHSIINIKDGETRKVKGTEIVEKYTKNEYRLSVEIINRIDGDSVFYDVGGYHGYHTILGSIGQKVYTFEPEPENLQHLKENIELNSNQDLEVIENPLWSREEELEISTGKGGRSHIGDGNKQIKRRATTLDEFVLGTNHQPPDIIKIDVEGAEYHVLKGGKRVLEKYQPELIIEVHRGGRIGELGGSEKEVRELLDRMGYDISKEIERGGEVHLIAEQMPT